MARTARERPDAASGLRFFESAQHGVLRSRGVMTLGLYGVLDINAPGKHSQNKRRLYGESPAVRFASPRSPQQTPPNQDRAETMLRPNRDYAETTPKQIQTQRRIGRSGANQTGRNREKQPSASMGAAAKRPRLPRKRSMPDVAPPIGHRGRGNPDLSFGSPRKLRPICRQDSPRGGDDRTIDQAPKRRFGMARHRWARGMAGHLRPGLSVDSTPRPAVSAHTDLECRSFGPSPARRLVQAMRHQSQRQPRAHAQASKSCFDCFAVASIPQPGIRSVRIGAGPKRPAERRNAHFTEWIPHRSSPSTARRQSLANVSRTVSKKT